MSTALWAQHEESQQHLLSLKNLVRDYEHRPHQAIAGAKGMETESFQLAEQAEAA